MSGSTVMPSSAAKAIVERRLEAQLLSTTTFTRAEDVVARLGAVQAQDYLGALWAIGLRLVGARERDIERAIEERAIVRSWPMRGTLHFLAAADARWMIDLLAPKALAAAASRLRTMGVDDAVASRARKELSKHLEGGKRLSRPSVYGLLERAGIRTEEQRGLHVLWRLAHEGLLCFGPHEGRQPTFVLLEEWLPNAKRLPRDEALAELARRYFAGHGPATERDFAWWSGLSLTEARAAITHAGKSIEEEVISGQRYWFMPSTASTQRARGREEARALPPFDELFVGYADRTAAIDAAHATRLTPFEILGPVVVLGGRLVATWKRRITGKKVVFSYAALSPLSKPRAAAVDRAFADYAAFFELQQKPASTPVKA